MIMNLKWDWFHYVVGLPSSALFGCVYAESSSIDSTRVLVFLGKYEKQKDKGT